MNYHEFGSLVSAREFLRCTPGSFICSWPYLASGAGVWRVFVPARES